MSFSEFVFLVIIGRNCQLTTLDMFVIQRNVSFTMLICIICLLYVIYRVEIMSLW